MYKNQMTNIPSEIVGAISRKLEPIGIHPVHIAYGSMLEKIVTYKNHTMTVFFSSLPFGIRLSYVTGGKGDDYHSDFRYLGTEEK